MFFLFLLIGLLKCCRIPHIAETRGVVFGTILFTIVCLAAFMIESLPKLEGLVDLPKLPPEVFSIADRSLIYLVLMTAAWLAILMAQATQPLLHHHVLGDIALGIALVVVVILGVKIGNDYYPLSTTSPKATKDRLVEAYFLEMSVQAVICLTIASRFMGLAGSVRYSIRRWREDNATTLGGLAE